MADYPGRPRVTKGALIVFGTSAPVPTQLIVFPLNPDSMSRRFDLGTAATAGAAAGATEHHTPATAPTQQITLSLVLDATDKLEVPGDNPVTVVTGLHPVIAAFEQLLYPSVLMTALVRTVAALGSAVITPATRPWVVFVWGIGRILPVKVSGLSITEQLFDPRLNPISARAELQLTVLSGAELADAPALLKGLADVYAVAREAFAAVTTVESVLNAPDVLPL